MQNLHVIELSNKRVLTSRQIAKCYEVEEQHIKQNFANNRKRFVEGKHYISLQNQALREFKNKVENFDLVGKTAKALYLWTEKGALLHAKSLNTDKAWEVYDWLVDYYFRAKEQAVPQTTVASSKAVPNKITRVDIPGNQDIQKYLRETEKLCDTMKTLISIYSRKWEQNRAKQLAGVIGIIGTEICDEAYSIRNANPNTIP